MEKVLKYFTIDGAVGGSQAWFSNVVMNMGGCAAVTACDSSIYFALHSGCTGSDKRRVCAVRDENEAVLKAESRGRKGIIHVYRWI